MTSGLVSSGTIGYAPYGFYRSWSVADGKYEVFQGRLRDKWNDYSLVLREQRQTISDEGNYTNSCNERSFWNVFTPQDELKLQARLVSAVRGHDFNLAVNAAQGIKTVDMVVNNLGKFGRAFLKLRHGDFAGAARQLGAAPRPSKLKPSDVPGRWLELQYGWLPLIGDTYEAFKAFHKLSSGTRESRVSVSKRIKSRYDGSQSSFNWTGWGDEVTRMTVIYEMSESLGAPRSLGLMDPLSVVWEILPYSFVLDWFVPIGTYLDNLSIIPALRGRFLTTKSYVYRNSTVPTGQGFNAHLFTGAHGTFMCIKLDRVVSNSLAVVGPRFVPFSQAMSPRRIWNALALTAQIFLRK